MQIMYRAIQFMKSKCDLSEHLGYVAYSFYCRHHFVQSFVVDVSTGYVLWCLHGPISDIFTEIAMNYMLDRLIRIIYVLGKYLLVHVHLGKMSDPPAEMPPFLAFAAVAIGEQTPMVYPTPEIH